MQEFLGTFIGDPYDWGGIYMAVYLAFPILATAGLSLHWRHVRKTIIVILATTTSATVFILLYCVAWGVHSTIGIGFMFALYVFSLVSVATVLAVRAAQSVWPPRPRRRPD